MSRASSVRAISNWELLPLTLAPLIQSINRLKLALSGNHSQYVRGNHRQNYTPESQIEARTIRRNHRRNYTPESQMNLYNAFSKGFLLGVNGIFVRRNHRRNYTPESQIKAKTIRRNHRRNYTPESQTEG